jgi:CRP-like cAMP-binding protein
VSEARYCVLMDNTERIAVLGEAPIFYGLSEDILGRIADVTEEVVARAGETLISKDDVEPWMYLLVSGQARVERDGATIATVTPGTTVGELAVLDPAPRSADVVATVDSLLLRIDHAHLAELMAEEHELTEGIIAMLVRMIRSNSERIDRGPVSAV